jgi:putative ABC transport system permease protein
MTGVELEQHSTAPGAKLDVRTSSIDTGYFTAVGIPILHGRGFTAGDSRHSLPVAVINETLAQRLWPGRDAVGRRFYSTTRDSWIEVVGVAADSKYGSIVETPQPFVYLPLRQTYPHRVVLHARAARSAAALLEPTRRAVQALDPQLPLSDVQLVTDRLHDSLWAQRMAAEVVAAFAVAALILAGSGIYSAIAYTLHRRRKEIAIRLALGSDRRGIQLLLLRETMRLTATGVLLGTAVALASGPLVGSLLYDVGPREPAAFGVAILAVLAVSALACYTSIARSMPVELVKILRSE